MQALPRERPQTRAHGQVVEVVVPVHDEEQVLGGGSMGGSDAARQITAWVQEHFAATTVGGATVYDLTTSPGA
ncbi:MAG TPA: hypothetical protein VIJ32_11080 [Actinomycetes bacterium]